MKDDVKFRLKMLEAVDEETLEWAHKASKESAKRLMNVITGVYTCVLHSLRDPSFVSVGM